MKVGIAKVLKKWLLKAFTSGSAPSCEVKCSVTT